MQTTTISAYRIALRRSGDADVGRPPRLAGSEAKAMAMGKGRLEAFTDGVIAIIITIMVLEMKVPHGADLAAVLEGAPVFSTYV